MAQTAAETPPDHRNPKRPYVQRLAARIITLQAGSHWPELVGRIQMIHAQGRPIWLAVLDVDTGDVLGVPTTHVIGKLENFDPAPSDWVEPEGPMESFGFEDWRGVVVVYVD